jgi:hypothetical protein
MVHLNAFLTKLIFSEKAKWNKNKLKIFVMFSNTSHDKYKCKDFLETVSCATRQNKICFRWDIKIRSVSKGVVEEVKEQFDVVFWVFFVCEVHFIQLQLTRTRRTVQEAPPVSAHNTNRFSSTGQLAPFKPTSTQVRAYSYLMFLTYKITFQFSWVSICKEWKRKM